MTKLAILTTTEQKKFDTPPRFNQEERALYFSLSCEMTSILDKLRTPTNKIGFILQLGYFKFSGKFFSAHTFRSNDIEYVAKSLGSDINDFNLDLYQNKMPIEHRKKILSYTGWKPFDNKQKHLDQFIQWQVEKSLSPKQLFLLTIDYLNTNKIEIPTYHALVKIITLAYNQFEKGLLKIIQSELTNVQRKMLDGLAYGNKHDHLSNKKSLARPPITQIKQINQSLKPSDIQENIETFNQIKILYFEFEGIISKLSISDQSAEYYATWVQKAKTYQLIRFPNPNKTYLHLLMYIRHQFYYRQDILIDIFLKSVQSAKNAADSKMHDLERQTRSQRNKAIKNLSKASKDSRELVDFITQIVKSSNASPESKCKQIELLLDNYYAKHNQEDQQTINQLESSVAKFGSNENYFDSLEGLSLKIQRRVSNLILAVMFNPDTSDNLLIEAINNFVNKSGEINHKVPQSFLSDKEITAIGQNDGFRVSLYKALLFIHIADAIKSGKLNLKFSYRYRAIHEYLIDENLWKNSREKLLQSAGMSKFNDFNAVISTLKQQLHDKYQNVNNRYLNGENSHLTLDKDGQIKVSTPKIENDEMKFIPSLLAQNGYVPILQVLSDVDNVANFVDSFGHFSIKHKKMKPASSAIFAGILGKGCNIGINRMANISVGISPDILQNTVNWCFSMGNIQAANNKILSIINKLALAGIYQNESARLHTSSDGRKVNVAVDSLHANYSYKYFGKGKGVTMYIFLDERQMLFHSIVISASEREAAYVIDGILKNEVIKSSIHSTDTHGFTESIFAATHFLDTAFAPRFKKVWNQKIYSFSASKTYEKKGYPILPSRTIDQKLIEKHWDDVLRFMVTIKLKHTTASQLFKRLSSYAKDNPLYQAIKEFGRIIKSNYILTYYDDLELRQRVEMQLNRVELSNKFTKAIFFANNQEFKHGAKEDQEIGTACMVLIQNAIVLWNYLSLSQIIVNSQDKKERENIIYLMKKGSILCWQHINLHGEYDFTKHASNDERFDIVKILSLDIRPTNK